MSRAIANTYHLRYFNLKARGEPIRWILKTVGAPYTEERMDVKEWVEKKKEFHFRRCPVLEVNGVQLHQASVICKYLAHVHGLAPSDPWERARLEEVAESIHDISEHFAIAFSARERKQGVIMQHFIRQACQRVFEIANIIEKNIEEEWIRSKKMTWVDVMVAAYMDIFEGYLPTVFDECPKLRNLVNKIKNIPAIKSWIKIRPPSQVFEILDKENIESAIKKLNADFRGVPKKS